MANVVQCRNVVRDFGRFRALDDVSFEVQHGEIFGIIGPNGAGKTTLLNCLEGLDRPSSGDIEVLGLDPVGEKDALTQRVGVQLQNAALPPRLTVRDALEMYSALYVRTRPWQICCGSLVSKIKQIPELKSYPVVNDSEHLSLLHC